jgi:fumarylacetoacetase
VRLDVQRLLVEADSPLQKKQEILTLQADVQMHLPIRIGDYTDFYSSIEHATNVGKMFRDPENALLPNWKHIPVGYHGRASSIVVSGTPIKRPKGQVMSKDGTAPVFKPSGRLDFELEMGFITGKNTQLGDSVSTADAADYIFGLVLFNDWSARDIQKWEYVPLGPFLGKSFGSSMSPWIVTLEALEPFKVAGPKQDTKVLPYLQYTGKSNYDIQLEVALQPENSEAHTVSNSNLKYMYWNMRQQLAHHTINGCNINVGDVMASGTISGTDESSYGSMLEISWGGSKSVTLKDGSTRTFIEDNDTVIMRGFAEKDGVKVGFGEVSGTILPSD